MKQIQSPTEKNPLDVDMFDTMSIIAENEFNDESFTEKPKKPHHKRPLR